MELFLVFKVLEKDGVVVVSVMDVVKVVVFRIFMVFF